MVVSEAQSFASLAYLYLLVVQPTQDLGFRVQISLASFLVVVHLHWLLHKVVFIFGLMVHKIIGFISIQMEALAGLLLPQPHEV